MNDSVRQWINGNAKSCTFKVEKVSRGHQQHRSGCGIHDGQGRKRTRQAVKRLAFRDQE